MEKSDEQLLQARLDRAEKAMEEAKAEYYEAKAEYEKAKEAFSEDWKKKNPNGSKAELLEYLDIKLTKHSSVVESCRRTYDKLVETQKELVKKMTTPVSDKLLTTLQDLKIEQATLANQQMTLANQQMTLGNQQMTLANHLIPFIEELKLEQFALAASTEKSNNQAVKVDCINYYNSTTFTSLPATIACQFLGIDFPTHQVTCSHIFQRKWAKSRKIIDLQEINDVKNLLLLFKPIEVAFDEGRICFLWDNSSNRFRMKILDPNIKGKTVLDLALRQFPNFPTTNNDPILMQTMAALEGNPLITGQVIPYKRCLAFHASRARYEAIHVQKWIKAEEFTIPEDAWSPNILETPELKSQILLWLSQD